MNEAEQGTEQPARRAASVRLIAGGTALGFAAAGLAGVLFVAATGEDGGGRAERIAEVDETTTTTAAPGDEVAVTTTVPVAGQPAVTPPVSDGGSAPGPAPAPAAASTLEAQVADHEQRITDLEQQPATAPASPTPEVTVPRDPPRPPAPPTTICYVPDITGDCDPGNNPPVQP